MPETIQLPSPQFESSFSLERALTERRSLRNYAQEPLTLQNVSQLLWAAQGVTGSRGFRTAPSAGALYPLEVYLVAGSVSGIPAGVYKYVPANHELVPVVEGGDRREALSRAALGQSPIRSAPVDIVFTAVYDRVTQKYGDRGKMYTHMEAGHAAQNLLLQAEALKLGGVPIGAFKPEEVRKVLNAPASEEPLYILPIGKR